MTSGEIAEMSDQTVIVIGAGVGGLTAALRLAAAGRRVVVLERAGRPGGKMRRVRIGAKEIDAGPTVFTMRWVFDRLFDSIGETLDAHLALQPAGVLARHAWQDGGRLDLFADIDRSADAIADFAGSADARGYRQFCSESAAIFGMLKDSFLCKPAPVLGGLVRDFGFGGLTAMRQMQPFNTMWRGIAKHSRDPRLRQLFGRYATYCGSSPYQAPATLMLVAHVEQDGVWYVDGGMYAVAAALAGLVEARGGRVRCNAAVSRILLERGRVSGVVLEGGERLDADAVVMNGDSAALAAGLLGEELRGAVPAVASRARSLSAMTWLLDARVQGFPLVRHSVFFSRAYEREFRDIFERRRLPGEPTVYVCAQDRLDGTEPLPDGPERLLLIVNAPATGDGGQFPNEEIEACESQTFSVLQRCGLQLERTPQRGELVTPQDFHCLFPGTGGALYGRASHGWRGPLQRPGCRTAIPGLYLAGGSVHPGPGVPMAALSGLMAAESLVADRASTRRSSRGAMFGGMSTR